MNVFEKFSEASRLLHECANELGTSLEIQNWLAMRPTREQRSTTAGHWSSDTFSTEAFQVIEQNLLAEGFTRLESSKDTHYNGIRYGSKDCSVKFYFRVEHDATDECRKLKARLAELGCHY